MVENFSTPKSTGQASLQASDAPVKEAVIPEVGIYRQVGWDSFNCPERHPNISGTENGGTHLYKQYVRLM